MLNNEEELSDYFAESLEEGFEGSMVRNYNSNYVNKRSYDLQKIKEFDSSEFVIIGITEGRGKLSGHAIFKCITKDGKEFDVKMRGETTRLKEFFENTNLWKNKKLEVQHQGFTNSNIPRFPVGKIIRDFIYY